MPLVLPPKTVRKLRRAYGTDDAATVAAGATTRPRLKAQWLAKDRKRALGEPFVLELPDDAPVEAYMPEGELNHLLETPPHSLDAEPPAGAAHLQLGSDDDATLVSVAALSTPKASKPSANWRFGRDDATFVFPIFAERYTDPEKFRADVKSLSEWIATVPPFDTSPVKDRFALHAYFWLTDPVVGQCNTRDIVYDCNDPPKRAVTFLGDNAIAQTVYAKWMLGGKYGLVLIDSQIRGGAGGMPDYGCPAWASTAACGRERWEAVALHEIGHALELADEYLDEKRSSEAPRGEPNCAVSSAASSAPWKRKFSAGDPANVVGVDENEQLKIKNGQLPRPGLDFIGMFQGARYSNAYYRASYDCLMRSTICFQFCPVCRDAIIKRVAP